MAYGPDGSQYPEYGQPPAGQPQGQRPQGRSYPEQPAPRQEPYYGEPPRPRQPRAYGDRPEPYDPFQTRAREQQQAPAPGGGRRGYGAPEQPPRGRAPQGPDRDQYTRAGLETASYDTAEFHARELRARTQGAHARGGDRLGATSVLEEDAYPPNQGGRDGDGTESGGRGRRKGKKPVPPHVRRRRKLIFRSILGVFLIFFGYVGITLYPYLTAPGTDRLSARIAEWGRDHHLSWAVTWLENATYKPPPTGGGLSASQIAQLQGAQASAPAAEKADLPTNITPLAAGTIPGEGVWHPVTMNKGGVPIVEKAALRPDAQHTSDLAYVVWMNQADLRFELHPGYQQPGGTWKAASSIGPSARTNLVATWNGGFKIKPDDALGGFYAEGRTAQPLVNGKAAEVFYRDGTVKIGQWGRDEKMTPQVTGVRQNLSLLVDGGKVTVGPGDGSSAQWGFTIKNSYFIARSGVGMTAKGDIVYVSGRFLSVYTLAKLLQAAGAVDAMELDINPDWVSFMSYGGADPANPTPTKLWDFTQPADRYFQPSDRDFVAVYSR